MLPSSLPPPDLGCPFCAFFPRGNCTIYEWRMAAELVITSAFPIVLRRIAIIFIPIIVAELRSRTFTSLRLLLAPRFYYAELRANGKM